MKHVLLLAALLAAAPGVARGDAAKTLSLEFQSYSDGDDGFQPGVIAISGVQAENGALGGYVFLWVSENYAVAHGGPTLIFPIGPGSLTIAAGAGIEQNSRPDDRNPLRLAGGLRYASGRHLATLQAEIGATQRDFIEPFYAVRYAWTANQEFDLGLMGQRHFGFGPRIDFWLHRPGLGVWFAPLYDPESGRFGGMVSFVTGY